jgi:hypothetical protein
VLESSQSTILKFSATPGQTFDWKIKLVGQDGKTMIPGLKGTLNVSWQTDSDIEVENSGEKIALPRLQVPTILTPVSHWISFTHSDSGKKIEQKFTMILHNGIPTKLGIVLPSALVLKWLWMWFY